MSIPSRAELAQSINLEELYDKLAGVGMGAGWNKPTPSLWASPRKTFIPVHWKYEHARGAFEAAGRLVNTKLAERRNLILFNPVEDNTYATVRTLITAYQMLKPGEWAREHRHTPNALRLILDATPGTYTVVDGVNYPMMPGDVLLTPNWSTHGHGNHSDSNAYWLDFLDAPLVQLLEPMFFEPGAEDENHAAFEQPKSAPDHQSPVVFPIAETVRRLDAAEPDPTGPFGTHIELGNPALETVGLHMMRLKAKTKTAEYRATANNIYSVVEGRGVTTVDGETFQWTRGDVIATPAWRPHFHEASEDAMLFRVTDEPVLKKLGFHRVEH